MKNDFQRKADKFEKLTTNNFIKTEEDSPIFSVNKKESEIMNDNSMNCEPFKLNNPPNKTKIDYPLEKYKNILAKLKQEKTLTKIEENNNYRTNLFASYSSKLNEDESILLSNNNQKNILRDDNSFSREFSMKLEYLDERKKRLFEEELNQEISREFSLDNSVQKDLNFNFEENKLQNINFSNEKDELNISISEIINDKETILFIKSLRNKFGDDEYLEFNNFFSSLIEEYEIFFQSNDEKDLLFLLIQEAIVTSNQNQVSLNAVEIFTKEDTLKVKVLNLVEDIRNKLKKKQSEEINQLVFDEIKIINEMLDKKNKELNERERRLNAYEDEIRARETKMKEIIENFARMSQEKLEVFFKNQMGQINKRLEFLQK